MAVDTRSVAAVRARYGSRPFVAGGGPLGGVAPRPSGSPPPKEPQAPAWQLSGALLLVLALATGSLHVLFADQTWWPVVVLVLIAVLGAAAATRALTGIRALPTVAATVVLFGTTTLFFTPLSAVVGVIPTFATVAAYGDLFAAANASVYRQAIPAQADTAIVFALCLGIGAVAVLADLVTVTLRAPAVTGALVLGVLGVPAVTRPEISDPFFFVLTVGAFLLLLVVAAPRRQPGLALAIGATALIGTIVLPAALPDLESRTVTPSGPTSGVNPVLTLGDDLRRSSERTVLDYATASGSPHYLRLVSLERFTGSEWAPTERDIDTENTVDAFGPVPGLAADVAVTEETTTVDIRNLTTEWLPIPYPARSITGLESDWYWDAEGYSVSSPDDTPRGEEYEVQSVVLQPTPEQLLAAGTVVSDDLEDYLALPEDLPEIISETADSVAAAAPTNYERAIALQEFFRSTQFAYSEDAPVEGDYDGTGMDIIAEFLDQRSGYCVHFASSMAVMARSLGIPSRVIVGFLPGTAETDDGESVFEVTTYDLHSWPELYFDGIGWVQFEPTPGRGELGEYANVENEGVPAPSAPVAPASPSPSSSAAPVVPSDGPDSSADSSVDVQAAARAAVMARVALALLGVVLLSLVPAGIRLLQRRRLRSRLRARSASAIDAWSEVLRTAVDLRMPVTAADTPRETAAALGGSHEPVARLLAATEERGYAATTLIDPASLVGDVDRAREHLLARVGRRARVLATLYPPSVWRRIRHPLTPPSVGG